ncbi:hypothetical protein IC757_05615 [Wenzhouxiangella sp. AB-CW3]|uniref:DUF6351 family protein n=1 Tax=Wenzhouxiangella sp. AB-CW3 TaxID=2771012 RepID=UPI00168BFB30|nr:DUF6351 family protein [Wenzhouxiangella sp. AB-CW3]QOC23616.1 hypothetical protein IC757_05615 [Wenzhouxiangella sp. AB-CW3]
MIIVPRSRTSARHVFFCLFLLFFFHPLSIAGITVVSSEPDQVTGNDVLISIDGPDGYLGSLIMVNGELAATDPRHIKRGSGYRVEGLREGGNTIEAWHFRFANGMFSIVPGGSVEVTAHPISGPLFSGPQQQPFVCSVAAELGVQPNVDASDPPGFRVYGDSGEVVGYSTRCSIDSFVEYRYRTTDGNWADWPEDGSTPEDLATTVTLDGDELDFVVRVEFGTINRFIYSFAMLVDPAAIGREGRNPDTSRWNGRLAYHFQGGVGIGHTQGRWADSRAMKADVLGMGHAIAYSTGNRTGDHYNLQVGGETALMTKEHFVKRYGEPSYTVGLGASGGAIQQYVYGQNHPGLIDAAIPERSYPDMVTQTIHVGDCELLEHYMDVTDRDNSFWQTTDNRSWLVGLNATDLLGNPFAEPQEALGFAAAPGMTECVPAWRGLSPLSLNPHFGSVRNAEHWEPLSDIHEIEWTHMDDLRHIYGIAEDGFARRAVDNVGVQYGLRAFVDGVIDAEQFLKVNSEVGGWKPSAEMAQEGYPFIGDPTPDNFDPWSQRNIMLSDGDSPAPRHEGHLDAIAGLYESGMIFRGQIDIPVIDIRDWLEPVLDMHNAHQSFAARQRILNEMDTADHHLIWFAGIGDEPPFNIGEADIEEMALRVMDDWMANIQAEPDADVATVRPDDAVDACFEDDGSVLAAGEGVWDGILDDNDPGPCTQAFPVFTTSRIEAGGPITGDVFKCQLKSVDEALADGTYGDREFSAEQVTRLQQIFPQGVCDYSLPDLGRPAGL